MCHWCPFYHDATQLARQSNLKVHCHAIQWFLSHFVVGKNNGGLAFFQTKRAQKVLCMPLIVVYIVLCSEVYYTTQLHLEDRQDWTIGGARQLKIVPWNCASLFWIPCRRFYHFSCPPLLGYIVFSFAHSWSVLNAQLRTTETLHGLILRRRLIAKLRTWRTCAQCLQLAGRRRGLESLRRHFWPQKNRHKNTE